MSPMMILQNSSEIFNDLFLDSTMIIMTPNKPLSRTGSLNSSITYYTAALETTKCSYSPRTRREAQLFKSEINHVQGEMIFIMAYADRNKLTDAHVIRLGDADYSVRFDVNEDNAHEPFAYVIGEKLSARVFEGSD